MQKREKLPYAHVRPYLWHPKKKAMCTWTNSNLYVPPLLLLLILLLHCNNNNNNANYQQSLIQRIVFLTLSLSNALKTAHIAYFSRAPCAVTPALTWPNRVSACEEGCPAGSAERRRSYVLGQFHPFQGQSINVRRPVGPGQQQYNTVSLCLWERCLFTWVPNL